MKKNAIIRIGRKLGDSIIAFSKVLKYDNPKKYVFITQNPQIKELLEKEYDLEVVLLPKIQKKPGLFFNAFKGSFTLMKLNSKIKDVYYAEDDKNQYSIWTKAERAKYKEDIKETLQPYFSIALNNTIEDEN